MGGIPCPFAREPEKASRTLLRLSPLAQASSPPSLPCVTPSLFRRQPFFANSCRSFLCLASSCAATLLIPKSQTHASIPNLISLLSRLLPKIHKVPGPALVPVPSSTLAAASNRIQDPTTSPQFPCLQPRRCPAHHPPPPILPRPERTLALSQGTCQPRSTLRFSCAPLMPSARPVGTMI